MGQRWREFLTDANGFKLVTSTINLLILNKSQTKTAKHSRKISVLKAFIINQMTLLSYNSREAPSGRRIKFFVPHECIHNIGLRTENPGGNSIRRIG